MSGRHALLSLVSGGKLEASRLPDLLELFPDALFFLIGVEWLGWARGLGAMRFPLKE